MTEKLYDPEIDTDMSITLGKPNTVQGCLNQRLFEVAMLCPELGLVQPYRKLRGTVTEDFRYERDADGRDVQILYATVNFERHPANADRPPLPPYEDTTNHQITGDPAAMQAIGTAAVLGLADEQVRSQAVR